MFKNVNYSDLKGPKGYRTRSLFVDICTTDPRLKERVDEAVYYLGVKEDRSDPRPSVREHFILSMDPTGYETAVQFFGTYEHWEFMYSNCPWFKKEVDIWKNEIFAKMKSMAIKKIKDIAYSEDDKQALAAAKYLATREYDKEDTRGRPSKAEITGKLKEAVQIADADREDMERIGLRLVK